jgi:hypothetical protein
MGEERKVWEASHWNSNHDIVTPINIAITTPATGSYQLGCELNSYNSAVLQWYEGAAIGVAGTKIVWRSVIRTDALEDETHVVLIEHGGTYTGGTVIRQRVASWSSPWPEEAPPPFVLKPSTIYRIVATTIADDNQTVLNFRLSKRR